MRPVPSVMAFIFYRGPCSVGIPGDGTLRSPSDTSCSEDSAWHGSAARRVRKNENDLARPPNGRPRDDNNPPKADCEPSR